MLTGLDDPELVKRAREIGTYGYMLKPFNHSELTINVGNALHRRELEIANKAHRKNLEETVNERTVELQETLEKLRKMTTGTIDAMTLAVEVRDPYTAGHQRRVADLGRYIATEMTLSQEEIDGIRLAGVLHDLGKISVPAEILTKPTRLTEIEHRMIQVHPQVAFDILKEIDFPWPIAQIVHQHHERVDGSGYPLGLSGEELLIEARVIAVADTVEAMSSHRPYRPAVGIEEALKEISQQRGTLYDPDVAYACVRLFREKEFEF
jgi:HD-GYP domain-containing protein (c-di-GMP phosphodiesterase class II)